MLHGAHVTAGLVALAALYVRSIRAHPLGSVAAWAKGVSLVLAPRRHHLGGRVPHDLGVPMSPIGGWAVARFGLPLAASAALAAVVLASPASSDGASPPSIEFGAELYAVQCAAMSWQRRRRGRGPGPDAARRRRGVGRFRPPDRPHAPRRPGRPGEARPGAVLRGRDPGARRLRRIDRQRTRHPAHRHRRRRHGEWRRPVPPELRGVPRGLRRRGTDRRGTARRPTCRRRPRRRSARRS